MTHLEAQRWPSNSELIEAAFQIHVWPKKWAKYPRRVKVLDVTYGKGVWWKWVNDLHNMDFDAHDLKDDRVDFRSLPESDQSMDVVAFDPDYIAQGGRKTSTIPERNERYGLDGEYETPASLQRKIDAGLAECARVVRPQGLILQKCSTYISSGKPWPGEFHCIKAGLKLGLAIEDIVVDIGDPGPQPKREGPPKHFRSNSSRLLIWRKPGRRTKEMT